jgi:competence protein ComFB
MKVKNYQEDLVMRTINLVLEDRSDVPRNDNLIRDVAAYTLNRMPPKYIMSERGFTRLASEFWTNGSNGGDSTEHLLDLVEMVLLIHRGIDVVTNRRKPDGAAEAAAEEAVESDEPVGYWHNFPHFIGKVADKATKKPVFGVRATLYINGEMAHSADEGWPNPYFTNKGSKGFYSFWPHPRRTQEEQKNFAIMVTLELPGYRTATQEMTLATQGDFQWNDYIDTDSIYSLGTCYLEPE